MNPPTPDQPSPAAATQLAGTLIDGRYQVERLLGTGGMSAVYLARHLRLGRNCAVKVLLPGRAAHPEAAARLEREAALASRISHPNICQVYDFGWTPDGLAWLAMEYLGGESLATALASGPFPPDRVAAIVAGCAAGLAAAHAAGIIHRDLKPANVMLVTRDGVETAVIMDFGIAWAPEGEALTRDGMMVGTPEVMSPEQIAGDPVDARSDQYQLALLACRLLTGRLPFQGATTQETMVMRLTNRPASLTELHPGIGVGADVQAVIERGLARRPDDRYPDVISFRDAFQHALPVGGEPATEVLPRPVAHSLPTVPGRSGVQPPGGSRSRRWITRVVAVILVGFLALVRPWQWGTKAGPPVEPDSGFPAPVATPAAPPQAPPAPVPSTQTTPLPVLPSGDAVFSPDSAVRRQARQQAEAVYRSVELPDTVRALAAYFVAEVLRREGLDASARQWLGQCLAFGERKLCRNLLDALP